MKKVLVTGGAGFVGTNLIKKLLSDNHRVVSLDNYSTGKKENEINQKGVQYFDVDLREVSDYSFFMDKPDVIFHLAALPRVQESIDNPILFEKNNTLSTINLLKACSEENVKRVIYSASSSAYGMTEKLPSKESDPVNPISPYANQKYYGELCCKMFSKVYGIETVSLRYFNVYGERQNLGGAYATVVGIFINQKSILKI